MIAAPDSVGGESPHSIEAEESLLSCCMLDGVSVLPRGREAGIRPESFYDQRHGTIFSGLCRLFDQGKPTEIDVLAEELKAQRQLDAVGGYAFLTQISSRIPTTAQATYFIEKVREFALRRAGIRVAYEMIDQCHNQTESIDDMLASSEQRIHSLAETSAPTSVVTEWAERRAGVGRVLKPEVPTLYLGDTSIFNRGNLGLLTALQKSGKSATAGAILGAIIAGPNARGDTLGFRAHNEHGHAVVHLDTEQSPKDHEALIATAKRRAEVEQLPTWLRSYGVKGISAERLRRNLLQLLRELKRAHGGVYVVLLDGVADFVNDTNDPKECNPFVTELEAIATDFDCSVVGILHLNPAPANQPTKSRGHLGSQLERKCETDLRLVKDRDGVTTMFTASARHAPIFERDGPRFSWDNTAEMHRSLAGSSQQAEDEAERESLRELAGDCYAESPSRRMRYSDLVSTVEKTAKCKERTAQEKVRRMKKLGVIREVPPRLLELAA